MVGTHRGPFGPIALDLAVLEFQDGIGDADEVWVVGGDQRGHALGFHHGVQQPHDLLGRLRVELPGGLVGERLRPR